MKTIKANNITKAYICLIIQTIFIFLGFYNLLFFIPAVGACLGYVWIDKKYQRCPYCNGFTNLDRLSYAKKHVYYCNHCGKRLEVEE